MFESMLSSPEQITFPVLFVGLLIYFMKTNDTREKQYRETIDKLNENLAISLNNNKDIIVKLDVAEDKIDIISRRIGAFKKENEGA